MKAGIKHLQQPEVTMKTIVAPVLTALVLAFQAPAGNKKNRAETPATSSNSQTSIRHFKLRTRTVPPTTAVTVGN
jgi:hypothetical protein